MIRSCMGSYNTTNDTTKYYIKKLIFFTEKYLKQILVLNCCRNETNM